MKLYVGNLSFNTTETSLQDAFEQFGTVTDSVIMMDRMTNRSRGFGFVTMSSAAEGNAAISGLHGKDLDGRNLTVNEAKPREDRPARSFDGGSRGGGSRRY
ncbi:RNA recognition motif domain-containing protein [Verrucomicrobiota bacterium sgz303538]